MLSSQRFTHVLTATHETNNQSVPNGTHLSPAFLDILSENFAFHQAGNPAFTIPKAEPDRGIPEPRPQVAGKEQERAGSIPNRGNSSIFALK